MNTFVKISSSEGGVFTADNNLVSFEIPSGQYYNLESGYLNLVCSVPITKEFERTSNNATANQFDTAVTPNVEQTTLGGNGVYMPKISTFLDGYTTENDNLVPNEAVVKNLTLSSQNSGVIEQIKRNDILRTNLKYYTSYRDDSESSNYEALFNARHGGVHPSSIFTDVNREGTIESRNLLRQPVRIPLKDMMNFCKVQQYNTNKYGRTKLRLELDLQRVRVAQMQDSNFNGQLANGLAPRTVIGTAGADLGDQELYRCINLTSTIGPSMKELMLSSDSTGEQTTVRRINREEDIPFYVGQKILIGAQYNFGGGEQARGSGATGRFVIKTRRIVEIRYNRGENDGSRGITGQANVPGSVSLILNEPIDDTASSGTALEAGSSYKQIRLRGADCEFGPFQVDFAELVLEQLAPGNVQPDNGQPIQYTTFETEEFTTPAQNSLQKMFECPANCTNLYVMRPENAGTGSLTSTQGNIDNYRIRVDNKDVSDRPIGLRSTNGRNAAPDPLHLQKLSVTLQNSNLPVKNLTERGLDMDLHEAWQCNNKVTDKFLIGQVLPLTNSPKHVQINIESSSAGPQRLALFKEVVKTI